MKEAHLRDFIAVIEAGSVRAAARRQGLTQSAISKNLSALERSFGVPLFLRSSHGVEPTEYGRVLIKRARLAESELRKAQREKIVTRRRGGWCYEMNGTLGWALGELGFRVTRGTGAVVRALKGEAAVGNHLVLRVDVPEGAYLADVGFGDGPRDPIRVVPGARCRCAAVPTPT